ncbi:MAG: hypothetical protein A3J74_09370 [Elusimicrobia bacterium RIFCSPHIGHO2_02_FULL_57_9]|nr:MAG: hypothetical protein A3J74_09370 [Elusimicrobia bacterium RIFCSPHIGHO2_02_FULL_57_9]
MAVSASAGDYPALIAQLRSLEPEERVSAMDALVKAGPQAVAEVVGSVKGARSREMAGRILARMGSKILPDLMSLLDDSQRRMAAGGFLFQLIGPESSHLAPKLLDCVSNKPEVKHYCGQALVKAMSPRAAAQAGKLAAALKDNNPDVRLYAAAALGQVGPHAASAVPALGKALEDPEVAVRAAAADALAKMGANAKSAVPALRQAAFGANPELKRRIETALQEING